MRDECLLSDSRAPDIHRIRGAVRLSRFPFEPHGSCTNHSIRVAPLYHPANSSDRLCRTHYAKEFLKICFDFTRCRIVYPALRVIRMKTHRHRPEVWVREHERVREPPGRVAAGVVHQDTGVGAVGHVHEHVVAVAEESVLQTGHVRLVVDDQVGHQRVGSQDFSR